MDKRPTDDESMAVVRDKNGKYLDIDDTSE